MKQTQTTKGKETTIIDGYRDWETRPRQIQKVKKIRNNAYL